MIVYVDECIDLLKNYVPKYGQANTIQGEMLRQIEKLRYEAQNNGNLNWDEDCEFFCRFLKYVLCNASCLSVKMKQDVSDALQRINRAGTTASLFFQKKITHEELVSKYGCELACVDDDIYDTVCNAIGFFYKNNPQMIPYEPETEVMR